MHMSTDSWRQQLLTSWHSMDHRHSGLEACKPQRMSCSYCKLYVERLGKSTQARATAHSCYALHAALERSSNNGRSQGETRV
jgi:hypothetical protein